MTGGQHGAAGRDLDPVLGRSLAETELLNRPAHRAGLAASAAVRRRHPAFDRQRMAQNRQRFRRAVLILLALLVAVGILARLMPA